MTVLDKSEVFDFLGNQIEKGSLIVYASMVGRSPRLTLGEVMDVEVVPKIKIKVQPLADSYGSRSNKKYDRETKSFVSKGEAPPVTLRFRDRMMVIT